MFSLEIIWEDFLKIIKEEAGSQVVETWFKAVVLEAWDREKQIIVLKMPNSFVQNWIKDNYTTLLKTHLARLLNAASISLSFSLTNIITPETTRSMMIPASPLHKLPAADSSRQNHEQTLSIRNALNHSSPSTSLVPLEHSTASKKKKRAEQVLNDNYHFSTFVVGPSNSLAHAAAYAAVQNLGQVYNPLFIYGATGLGKTHLLHAIGNEVRKKNQHLIVHYETADNFMNDFIHSIRFDKSHQFRERYRNIDLLLVDDVQFFSNKQQTQETFFHIFNILHEQQKQIVLSSDTFPQEIAGLQSRLKSRMGWGLVVDIQMPDLETKIAILKKKADFHEICLPDDVAHYIAARIVSNIRELEGSLIRIGAFASLANQPITVEMAKRVLLHLPEDKKDGIVLNNILTAIAKYYGISSQVLRSKKRHKDISAIRQVAFYLMKHLTFCSLQAIGSFVGGRDHSTVIHAISKVEKSKKEDPAFAQKLKEIEQYIRSS